MIREIHEKQDPYEYLDVSTERLLILENQLATHIKWFTHKNPYGCSICDLLMLGHTVLRSFESFLGPRTSQDGSGGQETLPSEPEVGGDNG